MTSKPSDAIRQHYDRWGSKEADRLLLTPRDRVNAVVHHRFLAPFIEPGMTVLEIGAGPGRFTAQMIEAGALVQVTDVSETQLALNRAAMAAAGYERNVTGHELCDIRDLSGYNDGQFDAIVAYGGPLSYAFEDEGSAMAEMLRVVRSGGPVVASVMSLPGTWRWNLENRPEYMNAAPPGVAEHIFRTGDSRQHPAPSGHFCRMFRWAELEGLVSAAGGRVITRSASNFMSMGPQPPLEVLEQDPDGWADFLDQEVALCREPGSENAGTHILVAASR